MSDERFVMISNDEFEERICDRRNNNELLNLEQILDLLNGYEIMLINSNSELHDTIRDLKEELKMEQYFTSKWQKESEMLANEGIQLLKENEQLQKELNKFKPVVFQDMKRGTIMLYTKR